MAAGVVWCMLLARLLCVRRDRLSRTVVAGRRAMLLTAKQIQRERERNARSTLEVQYVRTQLFLPQAFYIQAQTLTKTQLGTVRR